MMMSWWLEKEAMRAQVDLYNEVAQAHGHDPEGVDHIISCIASSANSYEQARAAVHANFDWFRRHRPAGRVQGEGNCASCRTTPTCCASGRSSRSPRTATSTRPTASTPRTCWTPQRDRHAAAVHRTTSAS